jgi:squalene-hopene/tetraprenyl-beta-curcumene cyclase
LPIGSSSTWPTAYISYKLGFLPERMKQIATPRLRSAAQWLLGNQSAQGGWGYNESAAVDADTTSLAILSLASAGLELPLKAYRRLGRYQRPDGGFCTFLPEDEPGSWSLSHPDVTPVALLALLTQAEPARGSLERGLSYVLRHRNQAGLWESFWWESGLYATEASLACLLAAGLKIEKSDGLAIIQPANTFDNALLISCLIFADAPGFHGRIRHLVQRLCALQRPDGSWESAPILRLPRRDVFEPWAVPNPGVSYADPCRLFTCATVICALARTLT